MVSPEYLEYPEELKIPAYQLQELIIDFECVPRKLKWDGKADRRRKILGVFGM